MTLYQNLMSLCDKNEAFFFKDHKYEDGCTYRIFNYRLASYTDFLEPSAKECRGIMFDVSEEEAVLVSMTMPKFFNWKENPFTEDVDLTQVDYVMEKRDGSLISTFYDNAADVRLKSKGSLYSEQAVASTEYMRNNDELMELIYEIMETFLCTINFEWTAPDNRIVVPYQEPELIILNVRCHNTGRYIDTDTILSATKIYPVVLSKYWVKTSYDVDGETFIPSIADMCSDENEPVHEGYVIQMNDGLTFKCKTERYMRLHRTKDDITNPKRLFDLVIHEQTDDLRSLFHYDTFLLGIISDMEKTVEPRFNHMLTVVEAFYTDNKDLSRKDYAIKGQKEMSYLFPLVMSLYTGKDIDYKAFALRNMEKFL